MSAIANASQQTLQAPAGEARGMAAAFHAGSIEHVGQTNDKREFFTFVLGGW